MTCYTPTKATYFEGSIIFGDCQDGSPLYLPCGRCIGCRKDLTKDWAVRCMHEAQMHNDNCVLTLTYNEDNIDSIKSLVKSDIQNFLKRLRKFINKKENKIKYKFKNKFSYLYCGEYGTKFSRPHFHIVIFGLDFPDKKYFSDSKSGDRMYTSEILDNVWGLGHATIGSVSLQSVMYCASYITKYVPQIEREEIYGERIPEFGHASKNPAIGLTWLKKYYNDVFAHDCIIIKGEKFRIPRYYLKKLSEGFENKTKNIEANKEIIEKFTSLKERRENKLDSISPDWQDLSNKYIISLNAYNRQPDYIKSSDNKKRCVYLENHKEHFRGKK